MKFIILLLTSLAVTASYAQSRNNLKKLNEKVSTLVENYSSELNRRDKREIRESLRDIQFIFNENGYYAEDTPNLALACDSSNNQLINLETGKIIHDFSSSSDCKEAKALVLKNSPFCDYNDNTVRKTDGTLIHDFSKSQDCKDSIPRIKAKKNFCDYNDNTLRKYTGKLIHDFNNSADCREALN